MRLDNRSLLIVSIKVIKKRLKSVFCFLLVAIVWQMSFTGPINAAFKDSGWGARPVGMGGAFTAVSDDANGVLYNPAGIYRAKYRELNLMHARLYTGLDYVDLYLVHWPVKGRYKDTWRALEKLYADGVVRAIGVSNFQIYHLQALLADCEVKPTVNQVEYHPFLTQEKNSFILTVLEKVMRGEISGC